MIYIQLKRNGLLETVDEFDSSREAMVMIMEYRLADPTGYYYLSSRSCKEWRT